MRHLLVVMLALSVSACSTVAGAKCKALRAEFDAGKGACDACLDRLEDHADGSLCTDVCSSTGKAGPAAVGACELAAREVADERAKSAKADKKD